METLSKFAGRSHLNYIEMFIASLDCLMTIAGLDETAVWSFDQAREELSAFFSKDDAAQTGHWSDIKALAGKEEPVRYFMKLIKMPENEDREDITMKAVIYPFITALADFYLSIIRL